MDSSYKKCYYDRLDVPKDASLDDIKKSYRKLSKTHHPDVATEGCPRQNAEMFKEISEAYRILSDRKERRRYDLQRQDRLWYQNLHRHPGSANGTAYGNMHQKAKHQGPKAEGFYGVLETMFRPRNFLMGFCGLFASAYLYNKFFVDDYKQRLRQQSHNKEMVQAWFNTAANRYEQPAPWDPTFRKLNPKLELVSREKVQQRTR